ncbi:MAG: hypothetical protein Q7U10_03450 [Thermodesulfovibrionia bacterium]|nr:hypothetical protein [Thermodesulfovibrionia bacterium]
MKTDGILDNWEKIAKEAESILANKEVLSIDVLISIIKRINPTPHLNLRLEDKVKAYYLKSELQSLLLTNYAQLFDLEPVQWDDNIVLLRYKLSPFVDACHAKLHMLSTMALEQVRKANNVPVKKPQKKTAIKRPKHIDVSTLNGLLEQASLHINNFEYDSARELLSGIQVDSSDETPLFLKGVSILIDELGAYDIALNLLFNLPDNLMGDNMREITANVCWLNNRFTDARGLFESCVIKELRKESIFRYADILYREKESRDAFDLLNYSEGMRGHVEGLDALKQNIYQLLREEAEPYLNTAKKDFDINRFETAEEAARTALSIFPEYNEARELLRIIRDIKDEDTVKSLWGKYEKSEDHSERLNILNKLQIKDQGEKNKIAELIEKESREEKKKQQTKVFREITGYLKNRDYGEAFIRLQPILKENDCPELIEKLTGEYPLIQSIINNEHVLRLKRTEGKESWLSYLQLREVICECDTDKALSLLKKAWEGFHEDPAYIAIREKCNTISAEQSRINIQNYLKELEMDDIKIDNAEKIVALIKKELKNLPKAEVRVFQLKSEKLLNKLRHEFNVSLSRKRYQEYCRQIEADDINLEKAEIIIALMEEESINIPKEESEKITVMCQGILNKLRQENNISAFRKSLLLGDIESATLLKKQIHDNTVVSQIEDEVASLFAVERAQLNVLFNTDINSALKTDCMEGLEFIRNINDEAFFNLSISDNNYLVIYNFNNSLAGQYKMTNFNFKIEKIIHADPGKSEYHLLCKDDTDGFYYIKAIFHTHNSSVMAHLNISELLKVNEDSEIVDALFLTDDCKYLSVLYIPDSEGDWDYRMLGVIDLYNGNTHKKKQIKFGSWGYAKIPTNPPRFLLGDDELFLYNDKLQKIKRVQFCFKGKEWFDEVSVNEEKRLIYIFMDKDKYYGRYSFLILDFDLNIIECHDNISPRYDLRSSENFYDATRDILFSAPDYFYDYKQKRILKNLRDDDFTEADFVLYSISINTLYQAIRDDGYNYSIQEEDNKIDFLNNILKLGNFCNQVKIRKPDMQWSEERLEQMEEAKEFIGKEFDDIENYEQWQLKSLNRGLLEDIYPDLVPKKISLNSTRSFIRQKTDEYYLCDFLTDTGKLVITNITSYIDKIVDIHN